MTSKHSYFCFQIIFVPFCYGNLSAMRERRGLEDTVIGVGVCHHQGVGWKGDSISVVDGNDQFKDMMPVHWNRLVKRPECVDRVEIYTKNELRVK